MKKEAKAKLVKPIANAQLAPLINQYINTNACWYLSPHSEIDASPKQPIRAELVIEQNNQQVGRWQLSPRTYGSIVLRHSQAQEELYAVSHVKDYAYENYEQLNALQKQARSLLMDLKFKLNKMLWARYTLDDTAGIDLKSAVAWWERSEQVETAISLDKLWRVLPSFGSPLFKGHSDHLAELIVPVQAGYEGLETFLAECPPPTSTLQAANEERTDGKGQRYSKRHWYTNGEYGDGPIFHNYYCPYNELEHIPGTEAGIRVKKQFYPNAPVDEVEDNPEDYLQTQESPIRAELLHIRQLIDNLLGQLD
jgi:hypothetical protein